MSSQVLLLAWGPHWENQRCLFICLFVTQVIASGSDFLSTYPRSPAEMGLGPDHHGPSLLHSQGFCTLL